MLKLLRTVLGILFFLFLLFVFIDFSNYISPGIIGFATGLQFIPSLLSFSTTVSIASTGFILILIITILFGRIYCSVICPLGVFQDIVFRIRRFFTKRIKFTYSRPFTKTRYLLVFLTFVPLLFSNLFIVTLLDPFSLFGRFSANIFRFFYFQINNLLNELFKSFDYYTLYHVDFKTTCIVALTYSIVFIIVFTVLSYVRGRLYCNMICPVGTFLGLLSKYALFKFNINHTLCTNCGACESVCKSECINPADRTIDMTRCVVCYNCISSCSLSGIKYTISSVNKVSKTNQIDQEPDEGRRGVLSLLASAVIGLTGFQGCQSSSEKPGKRTGFNPVAEQPPISPPGSLSNSRFTGLCTACHLCVTHCPSQVLKPSINEYGWTGIMQPKMDYHSSFCNYECVICSEICPTGAILPITKNQKARIQLGKVRFIRRSCIVWAEGTECGACSEHCPTKAVYMVPFRGNLYIPEVNPDICVGCGACEYACPTVPFKAIYIETNVIHQTAKLPEKSTKSDEADLKGDFPF